MKWQKENPFPVKETKSAHVSYKIASVLPGSEQFDFLKDWKVWFLIENLDQRPLRVYIKVAFISDGFRQELTEGYYGGEKPWNLNPSTRTQAPGLITPEEIKAKAEQKKKIEIQISSVIKDESDNLIEKKLPVVYTYDYKTRDWFFEP
jgi:hypothetical protein